MAARNRCFRLVLLSAFLFVIPILCFGVSADLEPVRPSVVAGSWYPGDPEVLAQEVDRMLDAAPPVDVHGRLIAIVSPHAGYAYSGPTAAWAFRQVMGTDFETVIILAPSHHEPFVGASVYARGSYATPLGAVAVDTELADAIVAAGKGDIRAGMAGHRPEAKEHALEIQLPFLQRALPKARIVPIVVGDCHLESAQRMAHAIAQAMRDKRVLIVASSDLYHGEDYATCVAVSGHTLDCIAALDVAGLDRGLKAGRCQACGHGPILIAMVAAQELGANRGKILSQTNSNDVTGQRGGYVVGYGAVAIVAAEEGLDEEGAWLPDGAQRELLDIARSALRASAQGDPLPPLKIHHPVLLEDGAAFVTLKQKGQLRGCIGYLKAVMPLGQNVQQMARKAALEDPRFYPVKAEEVDEIEIEISVLTPLVPLADVEKVQVGRHGLLIQRGYASGVLLPQVPVEQGWDRQTFLEHVCLKAGLPKDAWTDPQAQLWTFRAEVFGEH